jgi:hypothetical protein
MFLNWERKGKFYVGGEVPEESPFRALVSQVPSGYRIGIFFNKDYVSSQYTKSFEEAKSWAESFISKFLGDLTKVGDWTAASSVVPNSSVTSDLKVDPVVSPNKVVSSLGN